MYQPIYTESQKVYLELIDRFNITILNENTRWRYVVQISQNYHNVEKHINLQGN